MPRFMLYLWEDLNSPNDVKLGDHFISEEMSFDDAIKNTKKYIRGSLGRTKYRWDEGKICIHKIWDASEYAKSKNKFYSHGKIDEEFRFIVPGHKNSSDFHTCDPKEAVCIINKELMKVGQDLPICTLSSYQYNIAADAINEIRMPKTGNFKVILAELCARFGKTIWAGVIARETNAKITIVASYVRTVDSSFIDDLDSFDQFKNIVKINTKDEDYQIQIEQALKEDKQIIVFLSMCNGSKRQNRIEYLFNLPAERLIFVDEADFGAHCVKQAVTLKNSVKPDDTVVLMTGTNGDRAVTVWENDREVVKYCVTYPDLLMQKNCKIIPADYNYLQYFKMDEKHNKKIVDVNFYQMDLQRIVDDTKKNDETYQPDLSPSWAKVAADPVKAKGFFVSTLRCLFNGDYSPEYNLDLQIVGRAKQGRKVSMLFMPYNTKVENMQIIGEYAKESLPHYEILSVDGKSRINGKKISNHNVQALVKSVIADSNKKDKNILIIASQMAQRSFSIPEITELLLAYDGSESGSTIQKMSRALTPAKEDSRFNKTCANVISLSFDPNRDDKFDGMIIDAIEQQSKNQEITFDAARRDVLNTINIFKCTDRGSIKFTESEYWIELSERNKHGVSRIVHLNRISPNILKEIAEGKKLSFFASPEQHVTDMGKTFGDKKSNWGKFRKEHPEHKENQKLITASVKEQAYRILKSITENLHFLVHGTESMTVTESLEKIKSNEIYRQGMIELFGMDYEMLKYLFDCGGLCLIMSENRFNRK